MSVEQRQVITPLANTAAPPGSYASRVPSWVLRGHRVMGVLQLLTGVLVIIINIIGLVIGSEKRMVSNSGYLVPFALVGGGVWSGPFFIFAGISGLSAGRPGGGCTLGCVITCLVFSIMASSLAFSAMVTEAILAAENRRTYDLFKNHTPYNVDDAYRAVYGTGIAVVLLCAFELVLAIVHSAYACRASCCCVPSSVNSYQHQRQSQQQHVFVTGQQPYFTGQPGAYPGRQPVFYTAQSGPTSSAGYPVSQSGYPGQQSGYPGQQSGYPGQQAGSSANQFSVQPDAPPTYESAVKDGAVNWTARY